jgi:phosphate transport system permease protein
MTDPGKTLQRAKRIDRFMKVVISFGGLTVIFAVVGILLFIAKEAFPLFRPARSSALAAIPAAAPQGLIQDESRKALMTLSLAEGARAVTLPGSTFAAISDTAPPLPWLAVLAPSPKGEFVIVAGDGALHQARAEWDKPAGENDPLKWTPRIQWGMGHPVDGKLEALLHARTVKTGSGLGGGETLQVAGLSGGRLVLGAVAADSPAPLVLKPLELPVGESAQAALLSMDGQQLVVGTRAGRLLVFEVGEPMKLLREAAFGEGITSLGFVLGGNSILAGGEKGSIAAFQQVRVNEVMSLQKFHQFPPHAGPVKGFMASLRDKRFLSWSESSIAVDHLTTEKRLFYSSNTGLLTASLSPRGESILAATGSGQVLAWALDAPHTEVSWSLLWGKTHFEGYEKPEYVWQSTGGSDDFEGKFSLVPLLFGTLKGTLYALLFAVPLAIFGALYTSQFARPSFRNVIKPTVEVMAALPSVVLGFLAGLVLAPLFERTMVQFLIIPPLAFTLALLVMPLWVRLPRAFRRTSSDGREALWMIPLLLLAFLVSFQAAPAFERLLLGGDYRLWLQGKGMIYDQRNSIVVGFAMGFAVIPIIFTISEDALSAVPKSLSSASLACGASPWQTAWRVILPTASPGIFSATMVGFGRAIGETMIVLMATGNTPILDWSPFNGMRTLAANIAVEIPEAPHHGTLYRVLFLAALLLFLLTFVLNTLAELIRIHLRKRYESL